MKNISIITVCFNSENNIRKTIESVISQNKSLYEYIIIDGKSTDHTYDIIMEYKEHIDIIISEPDNGIYDAMNKGIKLAKGNWIIFMNSGDYFINNNVIDSVVKIAKEEYDIMFGDIEVIKNNNRYIYKSDPFYNYKELRHSMGFTHQSTFVKCDIAKKNLFDLRYKLASDYNMIISLYKQGYIFFNLNFPIAFYDLNGKSNQLSRLHLFETLCVDNPNSIIKNYILSLLIHYKAKIKNVIIRITSIVMPRYLYNKRKQNKRYIYISE